MSKKLSIFSPFNPFAKLRTSFQFSMKNKGFTLIELLVVISIISVLASALIVVINPLGQIQKANDAKRKNDLSQIQKALEEYYNDYGQYPANTGAYQITGGQWGTAWGNYIQVVPKDPASTKTYIYVSPGNRQTYYLFANLDTKTDPQVCNSGNACVNASANNVANACGGVCNYGLSSPNTTP